MKHDTVFIVNLFSKRKVLPGNHFFGIPAYKIFETRDAAESFVEAFEKAFEEAGNRDAEGYVDVIFEIEERIVYKSAEAGKEAECLIGRIIM